MSGLFLFLLCRLLIEFCLCLCVQAGRLGVVEDDVSVGNAVPASPVSVVAGMELDMDTSPKMVCCFAGGGGGGRQIVVVACGGFCVVCFYDLAGMMISRPLLAQIVWLGLGNVWSISVSSMPAPYCGLHVFVCSGRWVGGGFKFVLSCFYDLRG